MFCLIGEHKPKSLFYFTSDYLERNISSAAACLQHTKTLEHRVLRDANEQLSFSSWDQRSQYVNIQTYVPMDSSSE